MLTAHERCSKKLLDSYSLLGSYAYVLTDGNSTTSPRVLVGLVVLWLCWGSSFPAIRIMVDTLPPLLGTGSIFLTAGLGLAIAFPSTIRRARLGPSVVAAGVGIGLLGAQGAVAVAEQHVYASTAALIVAAVPLWVVLFRAVLGDRPGLAAAGQVVVGLVGVVAVLFAVRPAQGDPWSVWLLLVVAASLSWAAATLWASRSTMLPSPRDATTIQLITGGAALVGTGLASGELSTFAPDDVSIASWVALGYLIVVDSSAGFALYNWLLRRAPIGLVSTYAYAVPLVAYLIGITVLGEPFSILALAGAGAVLLAVAAEMGSPNPPPRPRPRRVTR